MIFKSPVDVSSFDFHLPDSTPVGEFALAGVGNLLAPGAERKPPFVCARSGTTYNLAEVRDRVDKLSRALADDLKWSPNCGSPWDKVVGIFSVNTLDFAILCWAVHRVGGVCLLLHATSSPTEVESHMRKAGCGVLFSCEPLLPAVNVLQDRLGIASDNVYLLEVPEALRVGGEAAKQFKTVNQLIAKGSQLPELEALVWEAGQGAKQVAYVTATSGTSGIQKLAKITHLNAIANMVQTNAVDRANTNGYPEVGLGIMPMSHGYGMLLQHCMTWRGDMMVIHPSFDMQLVLKSVADHRIQRLYLVPPIITALAVNQILHKMYDLSSVRSIATGAAPFSKEVLAKMKQVQPDWKILQGYGLTESGGIATFSRADDIMPGGSGCLVPLCEARLVTSDGSDVKGLEEAGEIYLRGPSVFQGYLGDPEADAAIFAGDGWMRTGDVGVFSPSTITGVEQLFVVDRVKDMIKVKGLQVAPAELEAHLLAHDSVVDVAVIGIPDQRVGERPYAYIVLAKKPNTSDDGAEEEKALRASINKHVESRFEDNYWLGKRIEFIQDVPKSQSGKILKKVLRDRWTAAQA